MARSTNGYFLRVADNTRITNKIVPVINATVTNGNGGFTVNYTCIYHLQSGVYPPVSWDTNDQHKITCNGSTQTKSFDCKIPGSYGDNSDYSPSGGTGSFWVSVVGTKSVTVEWSNDTFNVGYPLQNSGTQRYNSYCSVTVSGTGAASYTACTAPTSFTNGTQFYGNLNGGNGNVTVSWSGASGGTNNAIVGYTIQARYPGGDWYDKWSGTGSSTTLNFDGTAGQTITIDLRIQTRGAAGADWYSGWKTGSVVALGRSACGAPNSMSVSPSTVAPGSSVTLSWSGASSGLNNSISSYYIEWGYADGGWNYSKTVNSTSTSESTTISMPSGRRGVYIDIRITTRGSAGEDYYSSAYRRDDMVYIRDYSACGAPTTITIRSGSSTTSSSISTKECGSGNFYIHWNAGTAGTDNSVVGYTVYYRNKTNNGSWIKLRDTTSLYTYDSRSDSYDYDYTVQTRGSAGSSYYSSYGTYYDTIGMVPTNPTACSLTGRTNMTTTLPTITAMGQTGLFAQMTNPAASNTALGIQFSGGTGAVSYNIRYGVYEIDENAQEEQVFTTALGCGYVDWTTLGTQNVGSVYSHILNMNWHGRIVQYYANAVGHNGRTSTEYYMSKPVYLPGGWYFKRSNSYERGLPKLKVSGTYRTTAAVWRKVNGIWELSF